jgi:hypothetical protein
MEKKISHVDTLKRIEFNMDLMKFNSTIENNEPHFIYFVLYNVLIFDETLFFQNYMNSNRKSIDLDLYQSIDDNINGDDTPILHSNRQISCNGSTFIVPPLDLTGVDNVDDFVDAPSSDEKINFESGFKFSDIDELVKSEDDEDDNDIDVIGKNIYSGNLTNRIKNIGNEIITKILPLKKNKMLSNGEIIENTKNNFKKSFSIKRRASERSNINMDSSGDLNHTLVRRFTSSSISKIKKEIYSKSKINDELENNTIVVDICKCCKQFKCSTLKVKQRIQTITHDNWGNKEINELIRLIDLMEIEYLKHSFKKSFSIWLTCHNNLNLGHFIIETLRKYTKENVVVSKSSTVDNNVIYMMDDQFFRLETELNDVSSKIILKLNQQ